MKTSLIKAIQLILSADAELLDILGVKAEMSLQSSIFALLIGLPIGILLGACKFPGRNGLLICNRTLLQKAGYLPEEINNFQKLKMQN